MSKFFGLLIVIVAFASCSKKEDGNALPPNLQKMTETMTCICLPYFKQYKWEGKTVYLLGSTGPNCQWTPMYYDWRGKQITMPTGYSLDQFLADSKFIKTVWSCPVAVPHN